MSTGFYSIKKVESLILIRTTGEWTLALDIAYLSELSETFRIARGKPFNVFVDMRGLNVSQDVKDATIQKNLFLNRRSQRSEYWLTDSLVDTEYLLIYFKQLSFPLTRLTDEGKAWDILSNQLCPKKHLESLKNWFYSK